MPVEEVLALDARATAVRVVRVRVSPRERLDELVGRRTVGVKRRTLPRVGIEPWHAHEPRALMELASAVEAVQPDVPVVPLRTLGTLRCWDPRSSHRTVIVGALDDTSDGTEVPSGACGKPLLARYFPSGDSASQNLRSRVSQDRHA